MRILESKFLAERYLQVGSSSDEKCFETSLVSTWQMGEELGSASGKLEALRADSCTRYRPSVQ